MTQLRLVLEPFRSTYGVDDDVPVRVLLVNDGEDPVTVNARLAVSSPGGPGELTFSVIGPQGEPLPFGARVNLGRPGAEDVATIAPAHSAGSEVDLVDYFDLSEPGTYRVSAAYRSALGREDLDDDADAGMPAGVWLGTVESDEVSIQVR
ncbi:hypothetical protein ACH9EU_13385 [Kocuria sp. M1R5S2]|uniref:hypothetical protein n=1 Tax=Kocuria rhizosphaerae TaxID=3376285 RepID=UPI00378AB29B